MNSIDKRNSVMKDYDLVADKYCSEYGTELGDYDVIQRFELLLKENSSIVDLGGGSGKLTNYFINRNYRAVCYDFSSEMKKNALRMFPGIPYILDDIVNVKNHFSDSSVDGVIAMYSLFHIPREELKRTIDDIKSILKYNGIFCLSLQLGNGEAFVDEAYLNDAGKKVLYINYLNKGEIYDLLNDFDIIYQSQKREVGDNVIGDEGNDAIYIICQKK